MGNTETTAPETPAATLVQLTTRYVAGWPVWTYMQRVGAQPDPQKIRAVIAGLEDQVRPAAATLIDAIAPSDTLMGNLDALARIIGEFTVARGGDAWERMDTSHLARLIHWPHDQADAGAPVSPHRARPLCRDLTHLPDRLPQTTAVEVRNVSQAIADAHTAQRWEVLEGTAELWHVIARQKGDLRTKFEPSDRLLIDMPSPITAATLRSALKLIGPDDLSLFHACVSLAARYTRVETTLDNLMRYIGRVPESASERNAERARIWLALRHFESLPIIGARNGRYPDSITREPINLQSRDALIRIIGERYEDDTGTGPRPGAVPYEVTFVAGPWLDQHRGNRQVLTDYGDLVRLFGIPGGRTSGAWARLMGLSLHQFWRERSSNVRGANGEAPFPPVTREKLFSISCPAPTPESILQGKNPRRAQEYWEQAINALIRARVVGRYEELGALPTRRKGWQHTWLTQPIYIEPTSDIFEDSTMIGKRASDAADKRRRRRTAPR